MAKTVSLLVGMLLTGSAHGQSALASTMTPAGRDVQAGDVFARVALVRDEVELIRWEMGRPTTGSIPMLVSGAQPHEVYFQALTLYRKADKLCFQVTRETVPEPLASTDNIVPADVLDVVTSALGRLQRVKAVLGIDAVSAESPPDFAHDPTDVFRLIVQVDRQLNLMLDTPSTSSDAYQQVTTAVSFASRLLAQFPGSVRIPDESGLAHGVTPSNVRLRLFSCFESTRRIAEVSDVTMLSLELPAEEGAAASPSDVYDMAALLVSELSYLHRLTRDQQAPFVSYPVGHKLPSDVYMRAGLLESQVRQLSALAAESPDWLRSAR